MKTSSTLIISFILNDVLFIVPIVIHGTGISFSDICLTCHTVTGWYFIIRACTWDMSLHLQHPGMSYPKKMIFWWYMVNSFVRNGIHVERRRWLGYIYFGPKYHVWLIRKLRHAKTPRGGAWRWKWSINKRAWVDFVPWQCHGGTTMGKILSFGMYSVKKTVLGKWL